MLPILLAALVAQAPAAPPSAAPPSDAPTRSTAPSVRVMTLSEAVKIALERQPTLRQSQATVEAAKARVQSARAPLLPQVGVGVSYTASISNSATGSTTGNNTGGLGFGFNGFSGNANASQLIWDFGQTWGRYRAAQATERAQEQGELATRLQIILNAEVAYFNARANKDLVRVATDTLANSTLHLQQIRGFVEVGTRAEIDSAQARTDAANARVQLIRTQNNYETSKAQLNQAIGLEDATDYDVGDETIPPAPGEDGALEPMLQEALKLRPEFAQLEAQVQAQQETISAIEGAFWPSLGAGVSTTSRTPFPLAEGETAPSPRVSLNVSGSLTVNWPIFQGLQTTAQVREAKANLASIVAQRDAVRQEVRLEVDQARLNLGGAKAADLASDEALTNARERLKLAEGRYQTGVGSVIELSDAQLALTNAAAQKVQAQYTVAIARAQLLKALGRPAQ